jgi:hypothetical protein
VLKSVHNRPGILGRTLNSPSGSPHKSGSAAQALQPNETDRRHCREVLRAVVTSTVE